MIVVNVAINGNTIEHGVKVTLSEHGTWTARADCSPTFEKYFSGRSTRASGHADSLPGALRALKGELEKAYDFAGVPGVGRTSV